MSNQIIKIQRISPAIWPTVNQAAEMFADSFNGDATAEDHTMTVANWFPLTHKGKVQLSGKTSLVMIVSSNDEWNGTWFPLDFHRVAGTNTVIATSDMWNEEEAFIGTDGNIYGANGEGEVYAV